MAKRKDEQFLIIFSRLRHRNGHIPVHFHDRWHGARSQSDLNKAQYQPVETVQLFAAGDITRKRPVLACRLRLREAKRPWRIYEPIVTGASCKTKGA
jgi:hypothetical protein